MPKVQACRAHRPGNELLLQACQELPRSLRHNFVLHDHMRQKALSILRWQQGLKLLGQISLHAREMRGPQREGDTFAERT